jgi:CRP-like cAMP-binding protein
MQNEREIGIPFVQKAMSYSISTMAGHGSFIFVAFAYLEDEFLPLRMYAVCGISLSMIFQFYREVPLMLPFKWNALFLAINATMIAILLDEKSKVEEIAPDERSLYNNYLKLIGMSPADFLSLRSVGDRIIYRKGETIAQQGEKRDHLILIIKGKGTVLRNGEVLADVLERQFVGEMSYMLWRKQLSHFVDVASSSQKKEPTFLRWLHSVPLPFDMLSDSPSQESADFRIDNERHRAHLDVPLRAAKQLGGADERLLGTAHVVAAEDSVVYSFPFERLQELISYNKALREAIDTLIANDLNTKMLKTLEKSPLDRYIRRLESVLLDDYISPKAKQALAIRQLELNVSDEQHVELLQKAGWSVEEFKRGFRVPDPDGLETYLIGLKRILRIVEESGKLSPRNVAILIEMRKRYQVSYTAHLNCLEYFGWTAEKYEAALLSGETYKSLDSLQNIADLTTEVEETSKSKRVNSFFRYLSRE